MVRTMRSTTAAAAPQMTACLCWCTGKERAASAITTALSPDRMMLTQMIAPSPSQNCDVRSSSIVLPMASLPAAFQNSPTTFPSTRSILTAEGTLGSPGIVMISPQIITTNSAPAAVAPMRREHDLGAELRDPRPEQVELSLGVLVETVDRDDAGNTIVLLHVLDVALEVGDAFFQRLQVLLRDRLEVGAAVILHRANRRDDHGGSGPQARLAALDVDEFLSAEVRAEAGFGDHVIRELHRRARRDHGVAAVGDVDERAAVDEGGIVFERLDEVRLDRVLQEHGHRTVSLEVGGEHRLLVARVADHDPAAAVLEIVERGRQAEDRHDLGGDHDVESVLARIAVARAAQAHRDVGQRAVVHGHHPT